MKLFSFFYLKPYSCFKYWFFWHFKIVLFYDFSTFQNAIWPMFDSLFLFPFSYSCISCERGVRDLTEFCIVSYWGAVFIRLLKKNRLFSLTYCSVVRRSRHHSLLRCHIANYLGCSDQSHNGTDPRNKTTSLKDGNRKRDEYCE